MKEDTRRQMDRLGYKLPEGWAPVFGADHGILEYDDGKLHVNVQLTSEFQFVFTWYSDARDFVLPYEVIFALYLDRGVYGMKPHEAEGVATLVNERDQMKQDNQRLIMERDTARLKERRARDELHGEKMRRKKYAAKCDDLRNENRVYKSRVCTQRGVIGDINTQLMAALQREADLKKEGA